MCDVDHMLNGAGSRQRLQQMIRQAQQERFARDIETIQRRHKPVFLAFMPSAILTTLRRQR